MMLSFQSAIRQSVCTCKPWIKLWFGWYHVYQLGQWLDSSCCSGLLIGMHMVKSYDFENVAACTVEPILHTTDCFPPKLQVCSLLTFSLSLQVQARDSSSAWDQEVPEVHRAADQEAALPEAGAWDCSGLQDWPEVPVQRCSGSPGGSRGLPGRPVWGHQLGSHPRQESYHHAQGHPARSSHQRRESLSSAPYQTTPGDLNHHQLSSRDSAKFWTLWLVSYTMQAHLQYRNALSRLKSLALVVRFCSAAVNPE